MSSLVERIVHGDVRSLARACSQLDDRREGYRELVKELAACAHDSWVVGVTGGPGSGKSTLVNALVVSLRALAKRVAVLAVDPSSPFSGGAILGDRIRMQDHFLDPEVFIRSVATRGALGGLSRSSADLVTAMAAWRADIIIVETVGVGQDELDIASRADTTVLVLHPGAGDGIQAIKAGVLECADVLVVNKADHEGVQRCVRDLEGMLALRAAVAPRAGQQGHGHNLAATEPEADEWQVPIVCTVATTSSGVEELLAKLTDHRAFMTNTPAGVAARRRRRALAFRQRLRDQLLLAFEDSMAAEVDAALVSEQDIDASIERLIQAFRRSPARDK